MTDLIIRNGTLINAYNEMSADLAIQAGKIVGIAPHLSESAAREIDASGLYIFPGGIDPHVHFNEPGRTEWEGFATGSRALAAGGVTSFFDMPLNSSPPTTTVEAFDAKFAALQASSVVNGYLWGGLIPGNLENLEGLHQRGVIGFKAFMSNSGIDEFPAVDDYTLYEGMKRIAQFGALVAVHAENDAITGGYAQAAKNTTVRDYLASRPAIAELEAIQRAILFAGETGCKLHIVHVSTGRGVAMVLQAQQDGVDVSCETCPHYLVLTEDHVERLGAVAKCAPPLRSQAEQASLWQLLLDGSLTMVASDHSPSSPDLKQGDNFFKIWGGIAGCQSTLPLLLTEGVHRRGLALQTVAMITSYAVAERFGLINKGKIEIGADADLALVDLNGVWTLRAEDLHYRHKISPYVGRELRGKVVRTLVGGHEVFAV